MIPWRKNLQDDLSRLPTTTGLVPILWAAIYSVATSIAEGDLQGYEVSLKAVDGDMVTVILDKFEGYPGQCVFVKVAGEVTTEVVNTSNCDEVDLSY